MVTVRVDQFVAQGGEGSDGFFIESGGFGGWGSGLDVRRQESSKQYAHGSFDAPGFRSARTMTLSGMCLASSAEKLGLCELRLNSVLADGGAAPVYVDDGDTRLWATGRLAAAPSFEVLVPGSIASWALQLWFPDPRKFGGVQTFPVDGSSAAGVTSWHYGNFDASPVITVTGSAPQYTINGPTGYYIVNRPLVSGHPHVIDLFAGTISVDGARVFGATLRADTWTVPAGTQIYQTVTPTSGTATMRVAVTDTYI